MHWHPFSANKSMLFIFLVWSTALCYSQKIEIGFHAGTDYSLIQQIGQDFPLIINVHGAIENEEELSLMLRINTSPAWLSRYYSYIEMGAGLGYQLLDSPLMVLNIEGLIYAGIYSQASYDVPGERILLLMPGIVPGIKLNKNSLLVFPLTYYNGLSGNKDVRGLRLMFGIRYRFLSM